MLFRSGFRATFSTIAHESAQFQSDVIERQLAHKERNAVKAVYDRSKYLDERRRLMQWWADTLDAQVAATGQPPGVGSFVAPVALRTTADVALRTTS